MQVMHDDDNNITICTALYQSSGFFIIMSPAEGLHFSALVSPCIYIEPNTFIYAPIIRPKVRFCTKLSLTADNKLTFIFI